MMYNHMTYETSSVEFTLNRAVQQIKQAIKQDQQLHHQELDEKDEKILQLEKKLERLQSKNRELSLELTEIQKRFTDKENTHYMHMLNNDHILEQELAMERTRNEELRLELSRVKQDLSLMENKYSDLEGEHDKANHIIRTLVKKVQQQQRSPLSQATSTTGHQHHNRIVT